MLKFFRQIRLDQLKKEKTRKPASPAGRYLKYAIGEIILVVIGILIALQINNWNENRKEFTKQNILLEGIYKDTDSDLAQLKAIKKSYVEQLQFFKTIDTSFVIENYSKNVHPFSYKYTIPELFNRPPSFEISSGSYQAILNSGQSIIYRNRELFSEIQEIQIKIKNHLASIYQTIKTAENQINWKWNQSIQNQDFSTTEIPKEVVNDLAFFHEHILLYLKILDNTEKYMEQLKVHIQEELNEPSD